MIKFNNYLDDELRGKKIKIVMLDGEEKKDLHVICSGFKFPEKLFFEGVRGVKGSVPFVGERDFGIYQIYSENGNLIYENESLLEEGGILELTYGCRNEMQERGKFFI